MKIHTFPNNHAKAKDICNNSAPIQEADPRLIEIFLRETAEEECGILATSLAGKAIATSFVGAITGAFVIAELLRGLHGEARCGTLSFQLRSLPHLNVEYLPSSQNALALNGFVALN